MDGLILTAVLLGAVFVVGFNSLKQRRKQALKKNLKGRVTRLPRLTPTPKFHKPDDTDLDPTINYMNASKPIDATHYDLIIFSTNGIVEQRLDLSESELQQFVKVGNWTRTADRYRTVEGSVRYILQFERLRQ